jgi:hypothetical protein
MSAWGADKTILQISGAPPPGFEDLSAPQHTEVDIYYGGQKRGAVLATFTPESLAFDDPSTLVELLPPLKENAVADVVAALTGSLAHHSELLCFRPGQPVGCGVLNPDVAGVIFDMDRFKAEVFVNSDLLEPHAVNISRYLPPPSGDYSLLATVDGSLSGSANVSPDYSLSVLSILGLHNGRVRFQGYTGNKKKFQLDTLFAAWDWPERQLSAGILNANPLRLTGLPQLLGIRYGTSLNTRTDLEQVYGSQLSIFVPHRSAVDVYKDGRHLQGKFYDAGMHVLNTASYPDGVYDVTIRIENMVTQEVTEETRFFVKHEELPPLDTPFYAAELGVPYNEDGQSDYVLRFSGAQRLRQPYGYDADILISNEEAIGGLGFFYLATHWRARLGFIVSNHSAFGGEAILGTRYRDILLNIGVSSVTRTVGAPSHISEPFTQGKLSITWRNFSFNATWQRRNQIDKPHVSQYRLSPSYRLKLLNKRDWRMDLQFDYHQTEKDRVVMLSLRANYHKKPWQLRSYGKFQNSGERGDEWTATTQAGFNAAKFWGGELQSRIGLHHAANADTLQAQSDFQSAYGKLSAATEYVNAREDGTRHLNYSGQFSFGSAFSRDGWVVGGTAAGESAVSIQVRGNFNGNFQVLLNDMPSITVPVGKTTILPLSAYQMYRIRVKPKADTYAHYDEKAHEVVLYPGNVVHLVWEARRVFVLIGQVQRSDGSLLSNVKINGAEEAAFTDEQGILQTEVEENARLEAMGEEGAICVIKIPRAEATEQIVSVDVLACE